MRAGIALEPGPHQPADSRHSNPSILRASTEHSVSAANVRIPEMQLVIDGQIAGRRKDVHLSGCQFERLCGPAGFGVRPLKSRSCSARRAVCHDLRWHIETDLPRGDEVDSRAIDSAPSGRLPMRDCSRRSRRKRYYRAARTMCGDHRAIIGRATHGKRGDRLQQLLMTCRSGARSTAGTLATDRPSDIAVVLGGVTKCRCASPTPTACSIARSLWVPRARSFLSSGASSPLCPSPAPGFDARPDGNGAIILTGDQAFRLKHSRQARAV